MRHLAAFSLVLQWESAQVETRSLSSVSKRRYVGANRFVHALSSIVNGISPRPFAWLIQRDLTGFAVIDSGVTTHSPRRDSEPCAHAQIPLAPGTPPRHELQVEPHSEKRKRQCGNHSPQ